MTDIRIRWDIAAGRGDWYIENGGIAQGNDLETAVAVSLFTDRLASPDFVPTDGTQDRRGWWGDSYADPGDGQIGSDLWQLERAKKTSSLLPRAVQMCRDALQWFIDDGIVAQWNIDAEWQNNKRLALKIVAIKPDGSRQPMTFAWAWDALGV